MIVSLQSATTAVATIMAAVPECGSDVYSISANGFINAMIEPWVPAAWASSSESKSLSAEAWVRRWVSVCSMQLQRRIPVVLPAARSALYMAKNSWYTGTLVNNLDAKRSSSVWIEYYGA